MKSIMINPDLSRCICNADFYIENGYGVYDNQILIPIPKHMKGHGERHSDGMKKCICIDGCLAKEIQWLWSQGITTTGNCCGHNRPDHKGQMGGYIGVIDEDIPKMKELGYMVAPNKDREDSFFPRTTTIYVGASDEMQ